MSPRTTPEPEIIEGEAVEVPAREMIVAPQAHVLSGVGAVASIDDDTFERNLTLIRKGVERARRMQAALLDEGTDYGSAGNVTRPFLHKPGAEKLEKAYGLATEFSIERLTGDGINSAPVAFLARAYVHLGDHSGPIVGEGVGEANSWETKYRYRNAERVCPVCGVAAIKRGKKRGSDEDEFYCWARKDGCGARFEVTDERLASVGKIDNPDPWDLSNTLVKMAKKRAYVDGILTATGTSGLFTQDEDSPAVAPTSTSGRSSSPAAPSAPAAAPLSGGSTPDGPWRGVVEFAGAPADGQIRETPEGPALGFVLLEPNSRQGGKPFRLHVLAEDALAVALSTVLTAGVEATVHGQMTRVPFDDDPAKSYRRVIASRVQTPDFTVPAAVVAPESAQAARDELDAELDGLAF